MEILLAADIVPGLTPGGASPAPTDSGLIGWRLTRRAEARRLHSHGTSHGTLSWHAVMARQILDGAVLVLLGAEGVHGLDGGGAVCGDDGGYEGADG